MPHTPCARGKWGEVERVRGSSKIKKKGDEEMGENRKGGRGGGNEMGDAKSDEVREMGIDRKSVV